MGALTFRRLASYISLALGILVAPTTPGLAALQRTVDNNVVVVLPGNVHPLARAEFDVGPTDPTLPAEHIILALRISPEKQAALEQLLAEQQDLHSSNYHRWLTPEAFAKRFGRSQDEIALVTSWLQSQGFVVNSVGKARLSIDFSGTVGDVDHAFHTHLHNYLVKSELHEANESTPAIPRDLAPIMVGPVSLHNFVSAPLYNGSLSGDHYLAPGDFATIYNVEPLYKDKGIDGTGTTIAIVGYSNIDVLDVDSFRADFGLPTKSPPYTLLPPDTDPLNTHDKYETEAVLDVEWAGAIAPNATIDFVIFPAGQTFLSDGLYLATQYIVDNNCADVISVSYSSCELGMGEDANTHWRDLCAQAAAEGITVVVGAGDSGSADCDSDTASSGTALAVSGLCSTPYDVCVGGTEFVDNSNPSAFWSATNSADLSSALQYIPEQAWNESSSVVGGSGLWATGGGISFVYPMPSWQAPLAAAPFPARMREVPDVSLAAAGHDGYEIVQGYQLLQNTGLQAVRGTSCATPAFAGIMALVRQKTGQRQGNPDPVLYQLGAEQYLRGGTEVFHDVTTGNNSVPGVPGFACSTGYDLATGLGSVDAKALVDNWPSLGVTLSATPFSGLAPLSINLVAQATGEGYGTVNYTFWWNCPPGPATVQQATQQCRDPNESSNGQVFDTVSAITQSVSHTYSNAGTYQPLVIVERNNVAVPMNATVVVTAGASCTSFSIAPPSASVTSSAGSQPVAITGSPAGCQGGSWTASGNGSWISVSPTSGSGSQTATVSWQQNPNATSRAGVATFAGTSFSVTQAGTTAVALNPPYLLLPGSSVFPGTTTSNVSTPFAWLSVTSADSYQLELSDATTVYPVQTISAPQTSFTFSTPLLDNHAYKWRMCSHGTAGWGAWGGYYYFSTYTGGTTGDFSIGASPTSGTVTPGANAAFVINTTTVQGSLQALTLSIGNLPAGVTSSFSATSIQSGGQSTLTLSTTAAVLPGFYSISVSATSSLGVTHAVAIGLTVNPPPTTGEPAVCLIPSSLAFADQMAGTASSTQLVTLRNCGNGSLHISSLGASADFFIGSGSFPVPLDLGAGGATTFQVGFSPLGGGPRTGDVKIVNNAPGSPTVLPLSGTGISAPVTTGTVIIQATYNGQPWTGYVAICTLTWPGESTRNFTNLPVTLTSQEAGNYSLGVSGSIVGGGTLAGISPSSSQTLATGDAIVFTVNLNGTNDFGFSCPTSTYTGTFPPLVMTPSGAAFVGAAAGYVAGGSQTVIFRTTGLAPGTTATFNPSSASLPGGGPTTCTLSTTMSTPPGIFGVTLGATNQDGLARTIWGFQVVSPSVAPQMASIGFGGVPANGLSYGSTSLSANGRYLNFESQASNLVAGDTNAKQDIFVRDLQTNSTQRVSVATDGTQANDDSYMSTISADGRFVAFASSATNLVPGVGGGVVQIYIKDITTGGISLVSVAADGSPANGWCGGPATVSGDGRYVAFLSQATNLVGGLIGSTNRVFVWDRTTEKTSLASVASDGSPADAGASMPAITGDGRYVAFLTAASNLVPCSTANGQQLFVHDMQLGTTELVSGAPNGVAADASAYPNGSIAMTPDGRFAAFASDASNLVSGDGNFGPDIFVRDRSAGTTELISVASDGMQLGGSGPSISADGRFVAYAVWAPNLTGQVIVWDRTMKRAVVYSVGPGSVLAAGATTLNTTSVSLSGDGRTLAFLTAATNLVAGDTNGLTDAFAILLPTSGSPYVRSLTLAPVSLSGGGVVTGTVSLSGPAPAGGAMVYLSCTNPNAQVPAIVTIPAGTTSATFSIPTLPVWTEQSVSIVASFGGVSPWALLTLEPPMPARSDAVAGDGQSVVIGSTFATSFKVRVVDSTNNSMANVAVEFVAPATGASGTFAGETTAAFVTTDFSGIATAPFFTANAVPGTYAVVALAAGVALPATFGVSNVTGESLTITRAGAGSGVVTSSPAGIDCGSICSAHFADGTPVTLSAVADGNSTFTGWSGDGCSGTGLCQVTMDQTRSVTATFAVACPGPAITSFSANPALITAPASSTLAWSTSGATSVTLNGASVAATGTQAVYPTVTTPYTLLATNACGSTSQTVTVNVNSGTGGLATPTITTPSAGQTLLNGGVSFAWGAVGGATGYDLRLFGGGSGQTVFSGSLDGGGSTSALLSLPDGAYTFAVRACSGAPSDATCGAFGSVSFSISSPAPSGVPTVTFPTQGATLSTSTQTLTWTSVAKVDPASPMQYQLVLTDITTGLAELQISVLDATSTIFSLRSSSHYQLKVRACQAGCGAWSVPVDFAVTLPPIPTSVPVITNATVSGGNSLSVWWTGVANADLYQIQVVQPTSGPGGGALTVAAMQVSATTVTLPIPQGDATIFVWGCTGDGCGPQSAGWDITAPGPNPSTPNLGTPLAGSSVTGPTVNFSWNRIPGDTGSNTEYRLYVGDNARSRPALDVYTTANYYAANFKAEGTRYDALVIANPRTASPVQGPATGFLVRGPSGLSPTMVQPAYGFAVPHGNVQVEWTPIPGASVYEYYLSQRVTPPATPVTFQGVTPGLSVQVPLKAIGGVNTNYLGIVRACPQGATCTAASDAGWGIWSNQPGGGGLVEFTVTP